MRPRTMPERRDRCRADWRNDAAQLRRADLAGVPIRIGDIDPLKHVFVASLGGDQACIAHANHLGGLQAATLPQAIRACP